MVDNDARFAGKFWQPDLEHLGHRCMTVRPEVAAAEVAATSYDPPSSTWMMPPVGRFGRVSPSGPRLSVVALSAEPTVEVPGGAGPVARRPRRWTTSTSRRRDWWADRRDRAPADGAIERACSSPTPCRAPASTMGSAWP